VIDAIVIGGGPAGSSAALRIARDGRDVVVIERARFPRTKVCGEYLSPGACAALEELGLLSVVTAQAHPLHSISLAGFGTDPVSLRLPGAGALALARSRFDEMLLEAARAAGARIVAGTFLRFSETHDGIEMTYRDLEGVERSIDARTLVGADGAWSAVAQRAGMTGPRRSGGRWAVGGHLRGQPDNDALEMFVGPGGYYARNPLGGGLMNSMLVLPEARRGDAAERAVLEITGGLRRFEGASLEKQVAVGPLRYAPAINARGRVLLTGDAAGLLDPFVGQGMAIAMESSAHVATAVGSILRGDRLARVASRFASARRSAVFPRTVLAAAVDTVIRTRFLRARAERAIKRNPLPAEAILAAVAGAVPARTAFSVRAIAGLLA
jgi:2-polyprenyl-6-methoxyphenol hydroxylase-like FAD-dependent oxidoreductase